MNFDFFSSEITLFMKEWRCCGIRSLLILVHVFDIYMSIKAISDQAFEHTKIFDVKDG